VKWTKAVAYLTGGLVFVGIITAFIFGWQLHVMRGQLDAMERDEQPNVWITDNLGLPQFRPQGAGTKGQIVWSWNYTNFGKGRPVDLALEHFMRLGPDASFKHSFGATSAAYGGEIPTNKTNFGTTISEVVEKSQFDQWMTIDFGISVLINFTYSDAVGKSLKSSVCMAKLLTGAVAMLDPRECEKHKEKK
jgi:hypothetical protein